MDHSEFSLACDAWFEKNPNLLKSEVKLLARALEGVKEVLSVGFGSRLVESALMRDYGIETISLSDSGKTPGLKYEAVLLNGSTSDEADLVAEFSHAAEFLQEGGRLVIADVPKDSAYAMVFNLAAMVGSWDDPLLKDMRPKDPYPIEFIRFAKWRTTEERVVALRRSGFLDLSYYQTLTMHPTECNRYVEEPSEGFDRGNYVAIVARRIPFLERMRDGTLDRVAFDRFVGQDARYLHRLAETLCILSGRLDRDDDKRAFANYAAANLVVERNMLAEFASSVVLEDGGWGCEMQEIVRSRPAAVGVAAVYPCFRLYADAGLWLKGCGGPYARWVENYCGPDFVQEADRVEAILHRLTDEHPELRQEIDRTVEAATRLELGYWKI